MSDFSTLFGTTRESADIASIAANAARAGYAVLPVYPNSKRPMCTLKKNTRERLDKAAREEARAAGHRSWMKVTHKCGFAHAITDGNKARETFKRLLVDYPDLNIALEVGRSRMLCVDADNAEDVASYAKVWAKEAADFIRRQGDLPDDTSLDVLVEALSNVQPTVSSPGLRHADGHWTHKGGGHFWYHLPDDVDFSQAPSADPLRIDGAVVYFKDRVLLVPPSVREEGPYTYISDAGPAPEWIVEAVRRHIDGTTVRKKLQKDRIQDGNDPIDVWASSLTWAQLLEPDGWTASHRFDSCGCEIWTRPGEDWSSYKSATAHELGCTNWDADRGFLHVWTDEPPDYIKKSNLRNLSKLQYVAWRDHGGDNGAAMRSLNIAVKHTSPKDLLDTPPPNKDIASLIEDVTDEQLLGLRARMYPRSKLKTIPPADWLLKRWLPRNSLARVSGNPGSFKSFLGVDIACCVATGTSGKVFTGYKVNPGKVLYIAAEGASGMKDRITAWENENHVEVGDNLVVISGAVYAKTAEEWAELCKVNLEDKYDLIILDTQARMTAGMDENNNSEMSEFVRHMDILKEQAGSTILAIHHSGHEGRRGRGASSVWAAMDTELYLHRDKKKDEVTLGFIKSKESSEEINIRIKYKEHQMGEDSDGDPITTLTLISTENLPESKKVEFYTRALDTAKKPHTMSLDDAAKYLNSQGIENIHMLSLEKAVHDRQSRDQTKGLSA